MSADAKRAILERIGAAVGARADRAAAYAEIPRAYRRAGVLSAAERIALTIERLREYDAEVTECAPAEIPATIAAVIAKSGRRVLCAPAGLPAEWLASGVEWRVDHGLSHDQIEKTQGVVTEAFCGIAESGTIALHHSPSGGRRVLTLLPDWHLCVLRTSQIVETLPEYFARCAEPPRLATYVSGPSATADIEMTRIKGVHGPRFLHVVVVRDEE